ncbi:fasciclin domain-containing protein [Arcticibacter sp.]|uniref:fasciclin domain-containing protein n=1 Tax=Arcticibacter sp. TaxID=1872630 RepID=UPI00388DEA0F
MIYRNILVGLALLCISLGACKDVWQDHNEIKDPVLAGTLMEQISGNPELTKFRDLLIKTGYDKIISSSQTYTVWAPTNAMFDEAVNEVGTSDSLLTQFVGYHIARQSYFTRMAADTTIRVQTLNGKFIRFTGNGADEAAILEADQHVGNGVLHVISQPVVARKSTWEMFESLNDGRVTHQKRFLDAWNVRDFDVEASKQIGVNPQGLPIYDSVFVDEKGFIASVANLKDEGREFTYFVLTDDVYQQEFNKLQHYFADSTSEATSFKTQRYIVKDLVVKGSYGAGDLPATMYTLDSTIIAIDKSAIVASYPASNGMVHVVNALSYQMSDKIKPIIVEGERYTQVSDPSVGLTRRTRKSPDGKVFMDVMNNTHKVNGLWVRYRGNVFSGKYKVYWRMIRDSDFPLVPAAGATDLTRFPQKLTWNELWKSTVEGQPVIFDPLASAGLGYQNEPVINHNNGTFSPDYSEVYIGDMTIERNGLIDLYLVANRTATAVQNSILLDYIKLEPIY